MDIRQLVYFKEIVKQGSISKAAEVLNIAQPPLSQFLKKLESELGTTLIHRYRKKWELTETGRLLYQYALQTINQTQDVKQQILEIEQGTAGTLLIGVSTSCSNLLIDSISKYKAQFPNVKIHIETGNSEDILKKLEQKEIDVALLLRPNYQERYLTKSLKEQSSVVILPSSWSASFPQIPTIEEMAQLPFIMLGAMEGHNFYENILKVFEEHQVKPNIIIECKNITMVVALVSRGLGLSIIPKMDYNTPFLENVSVYEMSEFNFSVEPVFVKLKNESISKAANQFWDYVHISGSHVHD